MPRDEYLKHLASVPLFSDCSRRELEEIGRLADEIEIAEGREFIRQGDIGHELLIIVEGSAGVIKDGKRIATLGPGDFVGEMAVLSSRPRSATIVADTKLDVLVVEQRVIDTLLTDINGMAKKLLKVVASRCSDLG